MRHYHLDTIQPTNNNAERVVALQSQEFAAAHLSPEQARHYADPANERHVTRQLQRLKDHPDRYIGAFDNDELIGFAKYNAWSAGDQQPFSRSAYERLALACLVRAGNRLPSRPEGVHALAADSQDSEAATLTALHDLMRELIWLSNGRQLRVAEAVGTTSLAHTVVLENGFQPTGIYGQPLAGIDHELHTRSKR